MVGLASWYCVPVLVQQGASEGPKIFSGDIMKFGKGFQCHGFLCFVPPIPRYYY